MRSRIFTLISCIITEWSNGKMKMSEGARGNSIVRRVQEVVGIRKNVRKDLSRFRSRTLKVTVVFHLSLPYIHFDEFVHPSWTAYTLIIQIQFHISNISTSIF